MVDRQPFSPKDFIDTPFPGDRWRARDNYILAGLVLSCEPPFYETTDWEMVYETFQQRTDTEFKPGYLNALSCEMQYSVLESFIVRVHVDVNKSLSSRTETAEFIRRVFYLKFRKEEEPVLWQVLATYCIWEDVMAANEEGRISCAAAVAFGKEAYKKMRDAMTHKCPCEPVRLRQWWERFCADDDLVKPVTEEYILKLMAEENKEVAANSESDTETITEPTTLLPTVESTRDTVDETEGQESHKTEKSATVSKVKNDTQRPSSTAKEAGTMSRQRMTKNLLLLLDVAYQHREYSIFLRPVAGIPTYDRMVRRPICLTDIRRDVRNGKIASIPALRQKLVLMFNNAFFFNSVFDALYDRMVYMCLDVMKAFDELVALIESDE